MSIECVVCRCEAERVALGFFMWCVGNNCIPEFRVDLSPCVQSVRNMAKCQFLKLKGANEEGNGREVSWNPPSVEAPTAASLSVQ